jgi:hypothetical protein
MSGWGAGRPCCRAHESDVRALAHCLLMWCMAQVHRWEQANIFGNLCTLGPDLAK